MASHSNPSREGEFYLLADNWERKPRMPSDVNIALACLVSLRVLNTSGLRAVPVTFKMLFWLAHWGCAGCQLVMALGNCLH